LLIQVYQLLAHGRGFSPGTPASSTTKTGRHEIAEILLKVALNTKNKKEWIENTMKPVARLLHLKTRPRYIVGNIKNMLCPL
jgi:hypothetical protein